MTTSTSFRVWRAGAVAALIVGSFVRLPAADRSSSPGSAVSPASGDEFFLQKVHPLLEAKCFGCHGEEKDREGKFDMRTRDGLLKGGESGKPALVPGYPAKSRIFQAVQRRSKLKMPPKERNALAPDEIATLREWILAGAPWTEPPNIAKETKPKWEFKPEDIWAFQPLTNVVVPPLRTPHSALRTPVDAFI